MIDGNFNPSCCKTADKIDVSRHFTQVQGEVGDTYYCLGFDEGLDVSSGIVEIKQETDINSAFLMFLCNYAYYAGSPFALEIDGLKGTKENILNTETAYRQVKEHNLQLKTIIFHTGCFIYAPVYKGGTHYGVQVSLPYFLQTSTDKCYYDFEVERNIFPKKRLKVFEGIVHYIGEHLKKFYDYTDDMVKILVSENIHIITEYVDKVEKMLREYCGLFLERIQMYDKMCRRI